MKALTVIFLSSWKFAATFPIAVYIMKMSFLETLAYTNLGGIIGTLVSVYFSDLLIKLWRAYWPESLQFHRNKKKVFTKTNRWIVRIRRSYGLSGIVILSPVLLSIPLGSFLTVKYYGIKRSNIIWLVTGQMIWSVIYTVFYIQVKTIVI
jgi:uncharacterized membrane protein YdfJ with MMPL/SSD domain